MAEPGLDGATANAAIFAEVAVRLPGERARMADAREFDVGERQELEAAADGDRRGRHGARNEIFRHGAMRKPSDADNCRRKAIG